MRTTKAYSAELGSSQLFWFDSLTEFAAAADKLETRHEDRRWAGETWKEAIHGATHGRTHLVPEAESVMALIRREVISPRSSWTPAVAGAYAVIPEAICGMPEPMRRRTKAYESNAPIRVFVDLVSSAGLSSSQLARRGAAVLASTMILTEERAVELYVVTGLGRRSSRSIVLVKLQTTPLNVAEACYAFTSSGLSRSLGYSFCLENKLEQRRRYDWMFGYYPDSSRRALYVSQLKQVLDASESDVVVPPTFLGDELTSSPVKFILRSLSEHATSLEASL